MTRLEVTTKMAIAVTTGVVKRDGDDPDTEGWSALQAADKADFVKQADDALTELIKLGLVDAAKFD